MGNHFQTENHRTNMKTILAILLLVACTTALPGKYYRRHKPDVVDVAVGAGSFKTLVSIVSDLGLVDTLKSAKALTIFAPSDAAFAKIDPAVLASLTDEQKKTIVLRHVVAAKVPAAAVTTGPVKTIGGETIDLVKTTREAFKLISMVVLPMLWLRMLWPAMVSFMSLIK